MVYESAYILLCTDLPKVRREIEEVVGLPDFGKIGRGVTGFDLTPFLTG